MENLKIGDIINYHSKSFSARLIQFVTSSFWNHSALIIQLTPQPFIIEADVKGRVREFKLEPPSKMAVYRMPTLTPEQRNKIRDVAFLYQGSLYDFLIVWQIFRRMGVRRGLSIIYRMVYKGEDCPVPHIIDKFVCCSELVQEAYSRAGVPLIDDEYLLLPSSIAKLRRSKLVQIYGLEID